VTSHSDEGHSVALLSSLPLSPNSFPGVNKKIFYRRQCAILCLISIKSNFVFLIVDLELFLFNIYFLQNYCYKRKNWVSLGVLHLSCVLSSYSCHVFLVIITEPSNRRRSAPNRLRERVAKPLRPPLEMLEMLKLSTPSLHKYAYTLTFVILV
jgi:hypothetical protein